MALPTSLTGAGVHEDLPDGLNLISPGADEYGVSYEGFYHVETAGSTRFHWTHDEARIRVPIGPKKIASSLGLALV